MRFSEYLSKGKGLWIFLVFSIIFLGLSVWEFFNGAEDFFLFISGLIFFFLAIRFCPCYASKTCRTMGILKK